MTKQKERILQSVEHIKSNYPENFNPKAALIIDKDINISKEYAVMCDYKYETVPPFAEGEMYLERGALSCGRFFKCDIIIMRGRFHYYDGISMRDIGHMIYLLKHLGIDNIISVDEVAALNPRYKGGELALIYDHINLTGDNPLIGENDMELGVRFPDMSNAYDKEQYKIIYEALQEKKVRINESVYVAAIGPGSETDAEAHFYREIGGDVVGYSMTAENIAAVHAGMKFSGIGLITRELIADRMREDERSADELEAVKKKNLTAAEAELDKVLREIIKAI